MNMSRPGNMDDERKIKCVIFDLDGTLVDAYKAVAASVNFMRAQFGRPPADDAAIKRTVGRGIRHLVTAFADGEDVEAALSVYRQHHARALKAGTACLPGARKLLQQLKAQGYKLAIASNRPARFTHIILKHLQIAVLFDMVVCADDVAEPKPSPEMLAKILKKFAAGPDEALYVGDMTIDVETGQAAGVPTAAVITGSSDREEIMRLQPLKVMDNILEVAQLLAD